MSTKTLKKPKLNFWQIWNMSFGFLGIQFGFALQNANVSRIFETLGADIDSIPILWVAAPVTGLIVQPIIGYFSDRTWGKLGRRRPYFLVGAILASIALFIMPNSPILWIAAGMLWIMDASINISMEPFRAFVGDNLPNEQRTMGFAMQSFFIGTGAIVASFLPYMLANWFGVSNEAPEGVIPDSVKWSFYLGGVVFFLAVLWTVLRSKEYPPEELEAYAKAEKGYDEEYRAGLSSPQEYASNGSKQMTTGGILVVIGLLISWWFYTKNLDLQLYILSVGIVIVGVLFLLSGLLQKYGQYKNGFVTMVNDVQFMPKTMKQLAGVQFFSWFALFSMWIYTTAGVTAHKYDMKLDASQVQQLQSIANTIAPENNDETTRLDKFKAELVAFEQNFTEGAEQITTRVDLVNYFLNDKIISEEELVQLFHSRFSTIRGSGEAFEKAREEIESLNNFYAGGDKEGIKPISYTTFDYCLQNLGTERDQEQQMKLIHRLKHVQKEYNDGANWVGVCFGIYNGFAAVFAFFLMFLAKVTNRKITHSIALFVGALSLLAAYFIMDHNLLLLPFIGIGLVWASILSMPYAILTGALPSNKMGYYMGVFNFFIVIPQIVAAAILGFFISKLFGGEAIYAMLIGAASYIIAAVITLFVDDVAEVKEE